MSTGHDEHYDAMLALEDFSDILGDDADDNVVDTYDGSFSSILTGCGVFAGQPKVE